MTIFRNCNRRPQNGRLDINAATRAAIASPEAIAIGNFYYEIGDANGMIFGGSVHHTDVDQDYDGTTRYALASASKMIYGAYVAQIRGGVYTPDDELFLRFQSGWSIFTDCTVGQTVGVCDAGAVYAPLTLNKFAYSGGHMQKHADTIISWSTKTAAQVTSEVNSVLGTTFLWTTAQPAGGAAGSAADYVVLLRKMLAGTTALSGSLFGYKKVNTLYPAPGTLPGRSPISVNWGYSMGYWCETPDSAGTRYSSAGSLGTYPWIDPVRGLYGIIVRRVNEANAGWNSQLAGAAIRNALVRATA